MHYVLVLLYSDGDTYSVVGASRNLLTRALNLWTSAQEGITRTPTGLQAYLYDATEECVGRWQLKA